MTACQSACLPSMASRARRRSSAYVAPSGRREHHLCASKQRHLPPRGFVGHDGIPYVRLTADVCWRAATTYAITHAGRRQEVRLQLDRGEGSTFGDVVAASDRGTRVRQSDHCRCEEKAGPGDEIVGYVDVANH